MYYDNSLAHNLAKVLNDTKKINRPALQAKDFEPLVELLNGLSSLRETENSYDGYPLDQIILPDWCKPLLPPTKVAIGTGWYLNDLVNRPTYDENQPRPSYDENKVVSLARNVAQYFKSDVQLSSLNQLREGVLPLSSVNCAVKGYVRQNGDELFYPVKLRSNMKDVFGDAYFNMEEKEMVDHFFNRQFKFFN